MRDHEASRPDAQEEQGQILLLRFHGNESTPEFGVLSDVSVWKVGDLRISNLAQIKDIDPQVETVYIKPPAKRSIEDVVRFADVSFNIERYTIELLFTEALRQQKTYRVIIMVELGDLREGISCRTSVPEVRAGGEG